MQWVMPPRRVYPQGGGPDRVLRRCRSRIMVPRRQSVRHIVSSW